MPTIPLVSVSGFSYPSEYIPPLPKVTTPMMQKIEGEVLSSGMKNIGEHAFDAALQQLSKLLHHKNISVSTMLDTETGKRQVIIADAETGKRITELPPEAVVEIADRAQRQHIGWLMDRTA